MQIKFVSVLSCFCAIITLYSAEPPILDTSVNPDIKNILSTEPLQPFKTSEISQNNQKTWNFIPDIVAQVENEQITKAQLMEDLAPQYRLYEEKGKHLTQQGCRDLARNITVEIIRNTILKNIASSDGFKVTPEITQKAYKKFSDDIMSHMPQGSDLEKNMMEQGMNLEEVKQQLAQGEVIEEWAKAKILPHINISDVEIKAFYEANKENNFKSPAMITCSRILIKPETADEKGWTLSKEKAQNIIGELEKGADFKEMAIKYSCDFNAKNGGFLGKIPRDELPVEAEVVFSKLISKETIPGYGLVKSSAGWNIIKIISYEKGSYLPLDSKLSKLIKNDLTQQALIEKVDSLIDKQIPKTRIIIYVR